MSRSSFAALNLSTSNFCRPNARTTRTPVRFSCKTALILPSASSIWVKDLRTQLKNSMAKRNSGGTRIMEYSVICTWMPSMITSATMIISTARKISTTWPDKKRRMVSTSDVQRWIKSPVCALTW